MQLRVYFVFANSRARHGYRSGRTRDTGEDVSVLSARFACALIDVVSSRAAAFQSGCATGRVFFCYLASTSLAELKRFEEARSLMCKTMPVARRVLGDNGRLTLKMRWVYAQALYMKPGATLDDLREAVTTLEEIGRTARRVFGGAHPLTTGIEDALGKSRAKLRARETPSA